MKLYPFVFEEILKDKVWGGDSLGKLMGKSVSAGSHIGESWEISDHGEDSSVIANGSLSGVTLHDVFLQQGDALLGKALAKKYRDKFPLLIKLLDAQDDLSIQVHPDDAQAAELEVDDLGKTECWYVVHAEPGAQIIKGLSRDSSREEFAQLTEAGNCLDVLDKFEVKTGDFFFLPANTVHAICKGLVIAEIQQNSDTTYRVFDYNRPGLDGEMRELHIEKTLAVSDFKASQRRAETAEPLAASTGVKRWRMISCDKFYVEKYHIASSCELTLNDEFHVLMMLDQAASIHWGDQVLEVAKGQSILVPASLGQYRLDTDGGTVLLSSAR